VNVMRFDPFIKSKKMSNIIIVHAVAVRISRFFLPQINFHGTVSKFRVKHFSIVDTKRNKIHAASHNVWLCRLIVVLSRAGRL